MCASLPSLPSSAFLWTGMLLSLTFCPLFTSLFVWLFSSLLFVVILSCSMLFVWVPFWVFFSCLLLVCVCVVSIFVFFSIVLECLIVGLLLCANSTDPRDIVQLLSMFAYMLTVPWYQPSWFFNLYGAWPVTVIMVTFVFYCPMGPQ